MQTAVLQVTDKTHPITMHLPNSWVCTDEMNSFGQALTNNQKVILNADEKMYDPDKTWGDDRVTAMGVNHPIACYQEFEGGRLLYTALGHMRESFKDPLFLSHIYRGIYRAATGLGIA